jgi:hypothetical protein
MQHLLALSLPLACVSSLDVFVSPGGSDASSGASAAAPVATLHRARDLLRGAARPAVVHVGAGSYYLGNRSLSLGPRDGGGVRWGGAAGGGSVVYAGTRIAGWRKHGGGGTYRAPWAGPRFYAMTEGQRPSAIARHPDPGSGYLALTTKNSDTVGWVAGTVPDFTCTEPHQCQAYLQCNYFTEVHNVVLGSVNLSTHSLKYEAEPHCSMNMNKGGAYLMGALEFLSAPGEFAIAGGHVYYRPYDAATPIERLTIVASLPQRAVQFVAPSSAAPVSGITLEDLTIVGSGANYSWQIALDNGPTATAQGDGPNGQGPNGEGYQSNYIMTAMQQGQLYFENASGITVKGCELLGAGQSAVWMQGFAQNNTVTGNVIRDSGFCAVYLSGYCRASSTEDRRRRRLAGVDGDAARLELSPSRQRAQLREAYHSRECVYNSFGSPEETYVSKWNTISHNYMVDGNLAIGGFAGVLLYESGENQIVHNVIKRYARDAIGLFGSEPAIGAVQDGVKMNYANSNRFTQTKRNYVAWNDMSLTNQDSDDTGEIEMYGTGGGNVIEHNALHDIYDSGTGMHSVLFSDGTYQTHSPCLHRLWQRKVPLGDSPFLSVPCCVDWSPNTTYHSNLVGPFVQLAGGGDCDFVMVKSIIMKVDGNTFADSTAYLGVGLDAYENPVSQMSMTRNIFFNTTRMNPKPDTVSPTNSVAQTQHFYPVGASPPYNMTTDEYFKMTMPKCPESWPHGPPPYSKRVDSTDKCGFSYPLGKGAFEFPQSVRSALAITEVDYNYYAGIDNSTWLLIDNGYTGSHMVPAPYHPENYTAWYPDAYDKHGIRGASATETDAVALFHRDAPAKQHHELSVEDYTVRSDSVPATQLGFVPWNTSQVGVDPAHSRFTDDAAISRAGWDMRIQAEWMDRMEGVHPRGTLGQEGGVRAIGGAPAAGGSNGAPLSVTPGGWSRYERLDFGGAGGAGLAAVSARVLGAGTLVFTLADLEGGAAGGVRIATLAYNATALPGDPLRPGWALARGTNITAAGAKLAGLQTVYVQFWPVEVTTTEQPVAPQCAVGRCAVEGQLCKPGSRGSMELGYICCGVTSAGHGNWCPDLSIPCGPRLRRPRTGRPPKEYGAGCANTSASAHPGQVTTASTMALDYFVLERAAASKRRLKTSDDAAVEKQLEGELRRRHTAEPR